MEQVTHPDVKEAFEILKSVSATAQERLEAERRITYVRELNAIADYKWDEGMAQGIAIGEAKGRAEGKAEGKAEGMKSLLLHQLESKFGSLSSQCLTALDSASMEELARYSESLLSAASAEEVFKNEI